MRTFEKQQANKKKVELQDASNNALDLLLEELLLVGRNPKLCDQYCDENYVFFKKKEKLTSINFVNDGDLIYKLSRVTIILGYTFK